MFCQTENYNVCEGDGHVPDGELLGGGKVVVFFFLQESILSTGLSFLNGTEGWGCPLEIHPWLNR